MVCLGIGASRFIRRRVDFFISFRIFSGECGCAGFLLFFLEDGEKEFSQINCETTYGEMAFAIASKYRRF